jgi:hypothetical protein
VKEDKNWREKQREKAMDLMSNVTDDYIKALKEFLPYFI